jgi:glycosyltransferase involved in cell wall biosynthesis
MNTLVSVIIPCYNAERWVGQAIQCCIDQTHRPMEVIVVDDGSTDHSKQAVLAAARNVEIAVRLIECEHKGASAARNQGLAAAIGNYVQFLDADDLMSPRKIELQAAVAAHNHNTVPCGPWLRLRHSHGYWTTEQLGKYMDCAGDLVYQWLEGYFFAVHCFLWPRKTVVDLGGWDESLSGCQDGDLFIRAALKDVKLCFVPESVVYYRTGHVHDSVSARRDLDSLKSRIRVLDKAQAALERRDDLQEYRAVLAQRYYALGRAYAVEQPDEARKCFNRFLLLSPDGRVPGSLADRIVTRLLGIVRKEKLWRKLKAIRIRSVKFKPAKAEQKLLFAVQRSAPVYSGWNTRARCDTVYNEADAAP